MTKVSSRRRRSAGIRTQFDEAFYRRFYLDPATRVHHTRSRRRLASFIFAYLDYLEIPVRRVLDLGCGLGWWRGDLAAYHPRAQYTGVEKSEYLCQKYGWARGTVTFYRGRGRYDLVICQSVLQYVDDTEALASIDNLARLCRGALYFEVPTRNDLQRNADRAVTDRSIHRRSAAWYRAALGQHFRSAGGGVFVPRNAGTVLYELEEAL